MKLIVAIIRPTKLDEVKDALAEIGVQGLTETQVRGFGRQKGQVEHYRGTEFVVAFVPKIKLELAVSDSQAEEAVSTILTRARTGNIGDGKVFVFDLEEVIRIRTSETGDEAL